MTTRFPTEIGFQGCPARAGVEAVVGEEVARLEPLTGFIAAARVTVGRRGRIHAELVATEGKVALDLPGEGDSPAAVRHTLRSALSQLLGGLERMHRGRVVQPHANRHLLAA